MTKSTVSPYQLGVDIGSTTVKIAVLNENKEAVFSDYQRHYANTIETLKELILKAKEQLGDIKVTPTITGSGGLALAQKLDDKRKSDAEKVLAKDKELFSK